MDLNEVLACVDKEGNISPLPQSLRENKYFNKAFNELLNNDIPWNEQSFKDIITTFSEKDQQIIFDPYNYVKQAEIHDNNINKDFNKHHIIILRDVYYACREYIDDLSRNFPFEKVSEKESNRFMKQMDNKFIKLQNNYKNLEEMFAHALQQEKITKEKPKITFNSGLNTSKSNDHSL